MEPVCSRVESGRRGGLARAARLSPERRSEIARLAVAARWEAVAEDVTSEQALALIDSLLVYIDARPNLVFFAKSIRAVRQQIASPFSE